MSIILVVESDLSIQCLLSEIFQEEGYQVIPTSKGHEALYLIKKYHADLIIVNLMNPSQGGIRTIYEIKKVYPEFPCIIISGSDVLNEADYKETARQIGIDKTLSKPFDILELLCDVKLLLRKTNSKKLNKQKLQKFQKTNVI